jgi:starch phosphorylase
LSDDGDREPFKPLVDDLVRSDPFFVPADYDDYLACQARVGEAWRGAERWTRMSILNTARSFAFSSDRPVREYCERICHTAPVPVTLRDPAEARRSISDAAPDTRTTSARP